MTEFEERFAKGIRSDNPWWSGESVEVPAFKRSDYEHYVKELDKPRVHVLLGPRRCGKTTLVMQIIHHLLGEKAVKPRNILFLSLERPFYELHEQKLQDAIDYYEEKILEKQLRDSEDTVYLFVDEAHYDSSWSKIMKQHVDQKLPVYAIISGSSSRAVYEGQESGAGRFYLRQMVTLKFRDTLRWQNPENSAYLDDMSKNLRESLLSSLKEKNLASYQEEINKLHRLPTGQISAIKLCFEQYLLKGGYPEFWQNEWREISRHYQTDVFDLILQKDVVTISNIREPSKVRTLLVLIAQNTARILTRDKIRKMLNLQSEITVDNYVNALAEAFLIRTAAKYRKDPGFPSTKSRKYYAADTGLRNAVLGVENSDFSNQERGMLLETAIFNHCLRLLYHIDRQIRQEGHYWESEKGEENAERDIVLDLKRTHNAAIPIEVKNGSCGAEDIKKMKITINKLKAPFGFIICNDKTGIENENIMLLPPWAFLLSC